MGREEGRGAGKEEEGKVRGLREGLDEERVKTSGAHKVLEVGIT